MESGHWLRLIAVLKLGKGVLLLAAAIGAFGLVHRDLEDVAVGWAMAVHVDPDSRLARAALVRLGVLDDRRLVALGIGCLVYAGLLLTQLRRSATPKPRFRGGGWSESPVFSWVGRACGPK